MRRNAILLALAVPLLAAAAPEGCTFPWQAFVPNDLTGTVDVLVVNDAYGPVQVSLVTTTITDAAETVPTTQPAGGETLDRGQEKTWTFPCLLMPEVLAVKATLPESEGTAGQSATSRTLRKDAQYSCGSLVTFTVRQAARAGLVVGDSVD